VSLLATALSITWDGTVSTIGEAVASVSDTTAEAVSAIVVSVGAESRSAFGAYPRTTLVSSLGVAAIVTAVSARGFRGGRRAFLGAGLAFGAVAAGCWCSTAAIG
jgi:hypothetical protein